MIENTSAQAKLDNEALEFFFNSVDQHYAVINEDGSIRRANPAFRRFVAPAAGADDVLLTSYMTEDCRESFIQKMDELEVNETITNLKIIMQIGWDVRQVVATLNRSPDGCLYYSAVDKTRQVRLEQRRKETDDALAQLEELVGIGRWVISKTKPTYWSPGMFRMFGLDPSSKPLSYAEYAQMMSADDLKKLSSAFVKGQVYSSSAPVSCSVQCPDGKTRYLEFVGSPNYTEDGELDGVSGVALNKTDSVNALRSAMQTDSSIHAVVGHLPMGVAILDVEGKVSLANPVLCDLVQKEESHILGGKSSQLWDGMPANILEGISKALNGNYNELKQVEISIKSETRWVDWICAPWHGENGEICGAACIARDVTEIMQTKIDAEASQELMKYGLSLSSMMVWEIDLLNKSVNIDGDWKPFFTEKPSLTELTHNLFKSAHPEDKPRVAKAWRHHFANGAPVRLSFRKKNAAGREIWVSVASRQEYDENQRPIRMMGSMWDISFSQQTDLMVEKAEKELKLKHIKKVSLVPEIVESALEQLKSINELSEALQKSSTDEQHLGMLKLMQTSTELVSNSIEDIGDFASLHTKKLDEEAAEFNVKNMVDTCVSETSNISSVEARFADGLDETYIAKSQKISANLSKTIKTLQANAHPDEQIEVDVEIDNSGEGLCILTLDVKYASPKIPYSDSVLIELDNAEEEGLSMVNLHGSVEKLQGTVFFEKDNERITRILTELPIKQEFERELPAGHQDKLNGQFELSVLVAEDNPLNKRVLEILAQKMKFGVSFVENGEEAIDAVKANQYDVVIMDTQMPILNGISAIRTIRQWEAERSSARIPIIAAIPNMSFAKVREAMAAGANDCVAKPISQEDLASHLNELNNAGWEVSSQPDAAVG